MSTPTALLMTQKKPSTQFWLGFALGVIVEIVVSAVVSFIFQIIILIISERRDPDLDILMVLPMAAGIILFITTLIIVQKTIKNKRFTAGVAAGWVSVLVVAGLVMFLMFGVIIPKLVGI